ncbi:hypothetical protein Cgig2_020031 [Carnegiea gigantea]|uniref:Reverse transcriptase zinc-binding domain-containing protein n=1 Tax=Carnegiea gigantea TaxID=171969 RepID=A0A9Q1QBH2_9CARY|nr:hypothetical protein Cgig2_020031 [Carnegiea gigantea]
MVEHSNDQVSRRSIKNAWMATSYLYPMQSVMSNGMMDKHQNRQLHGAHKAVPSGCKDAINGHVAKQESRALQTYPLPRKSLWTNTSTLLDSLKNLATTTTSNDSKATNPWEPWALNIPPRIKIFEWKMSIGALATCSNLAKRIRDFNTSCHNCGTLESITHALFECPLASAFGLLALFPSNYRPNASPLDVVM